MKQLSKNGPIPCKPQTAKTHTQSHNSPLLTPKSIKEIKFIV